MSARSGLGVLETTVLLAVADLGGTPPAGHRKTDRVLDRLEAEHGIGPRYAYPVMRDLQASWRLHLPLLDGNGNLGMAGRRLGGGLALHRGPAVAGRRLGRRR